MGMQSYLKFIWSKNFSNVKLLTNCSKYVGDTDKQVKWTTLVAKTELEIEPYCM